MVIENGQPGDADDVLAEIAAQVALAMASGWISAGVTWTYASTTSFTLSGDYSAVYTKGMKFKATMNGVVKMGYFGTATYSSGTGLTTVPIYGDALTNHTISANNYSTAANPAGFTHSFTYTPATNITLGSGTLTGVFSINAGICTAAVYFKKAADTTLPANGGYFTVPIVSRATPTTYWTNCALVGDSGTAELIMVAYLANNGVAVNFAANNTAGGLSATQPMTWATNDYLSFSISYPII